MFRFEVHPAQLTVGGGVRAAWNLLLRTWEIWLPAIVILGIAQMVLAAAVGRLGNQEIVTFNRVTNEFVVAGDAASKIGGLLVLGFLVSLVNLVATWFFTATAISGLRGRPLEARWVLVSGLKTIAAGLLLGLLFLAALLSLLACLAALRSIGLLAILVAIPITVYVGLRLWFFELAIFDGAGVIQGLAEAWRLSSGAVLRLLGWGLVGVLIAILVSIVGGVITNPLAQASTTLASGVSAAINGVFSCFGVFLLAALYESQHARRDPGYAPAPGAVPPPFNDPWSAPPQ